ncbi:MAG: hypothetical protein EA384_00535 [Spirochaetaceae bacterium]|nr:MAG: hypothetical protein EA384_00535 [Spirochaetaceae bacterium]
MRGRQSTTLFAILLLVAVGWPSRATELLDESNVVFLSPRTAAIGGVHAALADDMSTLFTNPAGFRAVEPQLRVAEMNVGVSGPMLTMAGIIAEGMDSDIDDIIARPDVSNLIASLYAGFSLVGPLSFGYVGNGLGIGVTAGSVFTMEGIGIDSVDLNLYQRLLVSGGYAFALPPVPQWGGELAAGFLVKGYLSGRAGFSSLVLDLPDALQSLDADTILNEPFDVITGLALDVGLRYWWDDRFAVGLTVANLVAPAVINRYATLQGFLDNDGPESRDYARIPQNVSLGALYSPELGSLQRYVTRITLYGDYRNIIDFWTAGEQAENIVLKLSLGSEITLLEVLDLRFGFNRGLPAAGLGLDLTYARLNAAIYGSELSTEPGFRSVYNVLVGVEVPL